MRSMRVLISGAGIAGPALALCLRDLDADVTVVERASALRRGGQAVDFRGPVHREVLERLDLWRPIHERRTQPGPLDLIDAHGRAVATLPEVMTAGDVEILRGDLCRLLYERTKDRADYRFGDRAVRLEEQPDGVQVTFEGGASERFDLVVGADGLRSATRQMAMRDEPDVLRHHGYRLATFAVPNLLDRDRGGVSYAEPGRAVSVFASSATEARALLIYRGPPMEREGRDAAAQVASVGEAFRGMGWRSAEVLRGLRASEDLYVDAIATVHLPAYSRGRVALLGDAAWGGTLGGQGTSLAVVGAYVLSRELARAGHLQAFAAYEARMRPYASGCQAGARRAGGFFAPRSALALRARNWMYRALTSRAMSSTFERMVKSAAVDFELPDEPRRGQAA